MPEFPISEEALEAAANGLHDKHWPAPGLNLGESCSLCLGYAQTAINAFLAAEGFEVQRHRPMKTRKTEPDRWEQRLVGPWRPSEGS